MPYSLATERPRASSLRSANQTRVTEPFVASSLESLRWGCSPRDWATLKLVRARGEFKLPVVISIGEVHTILKLIEKPSMLCFFTVVYTLGLRLQEALNLQVTDIDSKRMMVHIHRGKGSKDRMIPLPESTLLILRDYYKTHRNKK